MASSRPKDREDSEIFLAAVRGARPLADRDRAPPPRGARPVRAAEKPAPGLAVEWDGESVAARAPGVNRRQIADLRAGRTPPEASLDLHRRRAADARLKLARFLAESQAAGHRILLVVTGKGRHSPDGPVLKNAAAEWLAGPLSARVLAFTTAAERHGGTGAFYVLLRRS